MVYRHELDVDKGLYRSRFRTLQREKGLQSQSNDLSKCKINISSWYRFEILRLSFYKNLIKKPKSQARHRKVPLKVKSPYTDEN